jgi:hypothetical protein
MWKIKQFEITKITIININKKLNYEYKIKKAIIIANKPIASHNANPNKVNWNNLPCSCGFLPKALNKPPKTIPIPALLQQLL